jgi:hypothetical protein
MDEIDLLRLLDPPRQSLRHEFADHSRLEGTGSWILKHEGFNAWLAGKNSVLWLQGPRES